MTRRRKQEVVPQWVKIASVIIAIIAILSTVGFFAVKTSLWGLAGSGDSESAPPTISVKAVSSDTMKRMEQGTILMFGADAASTKPKVFLIADPADISRESTIINGKPSKLLTAVQKSEVTLYLYPIAKTPERATGVESLVKAATCRMGAEKTNTGIYTINGIVKAGSVMKGTESISEMSTLMGMNPNAQCAPSSEGAATSTLNNSIHFAEHFQLVDPPVLVAGGELVDDISKLKPEWVNELINGNPAGSFVQQTS